MKKSIILLLFVALAATVPASAAASVNAKPRIIITVDYAPGYGEGLRSTFYSWCDYRFYFFGWRFGPCWP